MRDGREGINKAINEYEEHGIKVELTDKEKELIEYGYIQCMLQVGYDIGASNESFICGLQELSKFNSFIDEGYTEETLRKELSRRHNEIIELRRKNIRLLQESL